MRTCTIEVLLVFSRTFHVKSLFSHHAALVVAPFVIGVRFSSMQIDHETSPITFMCTQPPYRFGDYTVAI
jgi:hypothetical protein